MLSTQSANRFARLAVACLALTGACTAESAREKRDIAVTGVALTVADCPAGYNVIQGTWSNNTLSGTEGNDCILGHGGSDTIYGGGGDDVLIGGTGNDILRGGDGNDVLHGEDGSDRLEGQNHDDALYGGSGDDTMLGGSGTDTMYGGDDDDSMDGNAGEDSLYGGNGRDEVAGGDDNDRLFGEADGDWLYGDGGDDILDGGEGGDQCWAGAGQDVVTGGDGSDLLVGEEGDDFIADDSASHVFTHGGSGTDSCTGFSCELPPPSLSGCTEASQCAASQTCVADVGVCLPCGTVGGVGCNSGDDCPSDPDKTEPGICGCGVADTDADADGAADCIDACPSDPAKIAAGICGCGVSDGDSDSDGVADCNDICPGFDDAVDSDADGTPDGCENACPNGATVYVGDVTLTGTPAPAELAALAGVECIAGSVTISATTLTDLSALSALETIDGDLDIADNDQLASVEGLRGLTRIVGRLSITGNAVLADLNGLEQVESVGAEDIAPGFLIVNNDALPQCWVTALERQLGLDCGGGEYECTGNDGTGSCGQLPPGFVCEPGASGPGVFDGDVTVTAGSGPGGLFVTGLTTSGSVSFPNGLADLTGIECITGVVQIESSAVTDISALTLSLIGGDLYIFDTALTDLDGLQSLTSIRGQLAIGGNSQLQSLAELSSLTTLAVTDPFGFDILINDNAQLHACWVAQIEAQTSLTCGGAPFVCDGNDGAVDNCGG